MSKKCQKRTLAEERVACQAEGEEARSASGRAAALASMTHVTSQQEATMVRPRRDWRVRPAQTNRDRPHLWLAAPGSGRGGGSQGHGYL